MQRRETRSVCTGEVGLSLIELLIVIVVLPLVIGAAVDAFITSFRTSNSVQSRISQSHDAEITSAYFVRDVQSVTLISTNPSPLCGTGAKQVLGVEWPGGLGPGQMVAVSYVTTLLGTAAGPRALVLRSRSDDSGHDIDVGPRPRKWPGEGDAELLGLRQPTMWA